MDGRNTPYLVLLSTPAAPAVCVVVDNRDHAPGVARVVVIRIAVVVRITEVRRVRDAAKPEIGTAIDTVLHPIKSVIFCLSVRIRAAGR